MRLTLVWAGLLFIALVGTACGNDNDSGTANGPCGSNGACPMGYTCEPRSNICLPTGSPDARVIDAGPSVDAKTIDGGGGTGIDGGSGIDGGGGNGIDGGNSVTPVTTVVPQFTSPVNSGTVAFTLSSSIASSTFECAVDGGAFAACSSPFSDTLADGPHTLTVRATAPGGVHELSPPTVPFVIDTVAPIIAINSPPDDATVGNSTLVYSSNEPVRAFRCSFDGAPAVDCGAGTAGSTPIALANGAHTATVTGTDAAGNAGNVATVHFTVDSTVLSVSIDGRQTSCASESIAFAASAAGATFACGLDGATATACTSPFALPVDIVSGPHTFAVTATVGGASASNSLTFTIDRTTPTVDIIGILPDNTNDTLGNYDPSGTVFFLINKPGITATCDVDGSSGDCTTMLTEGSFGYGPLSDGGNPHTATVMITDACGPTAVSTFQFSVDSTPPVPCFTDVQTTGGPDLANGGQCLTALPPKSGPSGTLTFAAEAGSYSCTLIADSGPAKLPGEPPPTTIGPVNCSPGSAIPFENLTDFGTNGLGWTLSVDGIDVHGNHSVTALPWIVDHTPPQVVVGAATPNAAAGSLRVAYAVTPGLDVTEGVTFPVCTLDGHACTCDATGMTCTQVAAGDHVASVQPRDHWTNTGGAATNANPLVMTYGPNGGRLILIGHDFDLQNGNTTAVLDAALTDVPGIQSGALTRKPRVLWLAPASGNAAAFANVSGDWATVIDVANSDALDDFTKIDSELPDHDVLFVFDQNNATTSTTVGTLWNTVTTGGETHLTHFLDNGGVVIVLDGTTGAALSNTWNVVAAGASPAFDVSASTNATGALLEYAPTLTEVGDPTAVSDLFAVDSYAAPVNSVAFQLGEGESDALPRAVYDEECFFENCRVLPVVVWEKIFPVYTMSVVTTDVNLPGGPTGFAITPATPGTTTCVLTVEAGGNACGGNNTRCACPASGGNFTFPDTTGTYLMEFFHKDPNGRPGRFLDVEVTTGLTLETTDPVSTQAGLTVCLRVRPQTLNLPISYIEDNENASVDNPKSTSCANYDASITFDECTEGNRTLSAQDAAGNTSQEVQIQFTGCQLQ